MLIAMLWLKYTGNRGESCVGGLAPRFGAIFDAGILKDA